MTCTTGVDFIIETYIALAGGSLDISEGSGIWQRCKLLDRVICLTPGIYTVVILFVAASETIFERRHTRDCFLIFCTQCVREGERTV